MRRVIHRPATGWLEIPVPAPLRAQLFADGSRDVAAAICFLDPDEADHA